MDLVLVYKYCEINNKKNSIESENIKKNIKWTKLKRIKSVPNKYIA